MARKEAGFESASEAARTFGVRGPGYGHHENGTRAYARKAATYAGWFGVSADWLLTGRGSMKGSVEIALRGQIGAGEIVAPTDSTHEMARGGAVELPRPRDSEAFVVRGDSMQPRFFRGEILVFEARATVPAEKLIGQICRVELTDGSSLVKILRKEGAVWKLYSIRLYEPVIETPEIRNVYRWLALLPPRRAEALLFATPAPEEAQMPPQLLNHARADGMRRA